MSSDCREQPNWARDELTRPQVPKESRETKSNNQPLLQDDFQDLRDEGYEFVPVDLFFNVGFFVPRLSRGVSWGLGDAHQGTTIWRCWQSTREQRQEDGESIFLMTATIPQSAGME